MSIEELFELLLTDNASAVLRLNEERLFDLIPELKECKGFNQNNEWHVYDVYEHILHVVDNVPNDIVMRLTALFHDIGKPLSYTEDEKGKGHFYGHWEVSQRIFDLFSKRNNLDKNISSRVSDLIYYHDINISKLDEERLNEMLKRLGVDGIKQLFEIKRADLLAQNKKFHYILDDYSKQKEKVLLKLQ